MMERLSDIFRVTLLITSRSTELLPETLTSENRGGKNVIRRTWEYRQNLLSMKLRVWIITNYTIIIIIIIIINFVSYSSREMMEILGVHWLMN